MSSLPAIYKHCCTAYEKMMEESTEEETPDGKVVKVYKGFLTQLVKDMGFSVPYYSHIRAELVRMDCIRQLKRGGGNSHSQWLLVQPPSPELFKFVITNSTKKSSRRTNEQRLNDLNERVSVLEHNVNALISALSEKESNGESG